MAVPYELTVRRLMNAEPVRVLPDQPVEAAVQLMNSRRVGAIVVADEASRVVGIFTERDFLRLSCEGPSTKLSTPIRDWMSPYPYTIHPNAGWEEAVASMERLRVRHLPVVENGKLVGILTTRQLVGQRANYLNQVVAERTLELRKANDELLARDAEVTHYMKSAARLQKQLVLPQSPPDWPEVNWGIHYAPLDPLGGDLYGFARPDENHLGVLIADASGHGIPAAMVAILAKTAFAETSRATTHPGEVLAAMNSRLQDMTDERFVTAFYGVFNRHSRRFTYANAGHPFPIWYSAKHRSCIELSARGFLLGVMPDEVYTERFVELEPGDRLCLFTDGVADCRDERGESFGTERIPELLREFAAKDADGLTEAFVEALKSFTGTAHANDDVTFVIAEVR